MANSDAPALKRVLGTWNLVLFGIVAIAPVAGITMYGFVAARSAGAVLPSYLLAGAGVCLTAMSFAAMAQAAPGAGSVYGYAGTAMGRTAGFLGGWAILLDYVLLNALVIVFGAYYLVGALPGLNLDLVTVAFALFSGVVGVLGISWSSKSDIVMTAVQGLVVAGVVFGGAALIWGLAPADGAPAALHAAPLWPEAATLGGVVSGASAAIITFIGFDAISTLGDEVAGHSPGRSIAVATVAAVLVMTAIFVVTGWALGGMATDMADLDPATAGFQIVDRHLPWLSLPLGVVAGVAIGLGGNLVCLSGSARILMAMARDRMLPAPLARVHGGFGSPWVAVLAVFAVAAPLAFFGLENADLLGSLVSFGALTGFLLVNLSVVAHYGLRQGSRDWLRHWVLPLAGAAVVVDIMAGIQPLARDLGLAWLALGVAIRFTMPQLARRGLAG